MAANEYVQQAAAQLQNGASALKADMDQIRAEYMTYERQATSDINNMEAELHAISIRQAAGQPDATDAAMHIRMQALKHDIDKKKHEISDKKGRMNNDLRAKEGAMNDLMSQSRGLQNKAASLK